MNELQQIIELATVLKEANLSIDDLKNLIGAKAQVVDATEIKEVTKVIPKKKKSSIGTQTVQPIRDPKLIEEMKKTLGKKTKRNSLLFTMGINVGLRISDLLKLTVGDVRDKDSLMLAEKKTSKGRKVYINSMLKAEIDMFIEGKEDEEFLFKSNKGDNKPMTRVQAYRIINNAAKTLGLEEVGTHTLRKTFGYHHYKQHKNIAMLQQIFNHSTPQITLTYIGISQEEIECSINEFFI